MRTRHLLIGMTSLLMPLAAQALGLGDIHVYSKLNQPFRAEAPILGVAGTALSQIHVKLAGETQFDNMGLVRASSLKQLKFVVTKNKRGQAVLKMSSKQPINDPSINLLVDVEWGDGQLYRGYTVLLDPPRYATRQVTRASVPAVKPQPDAPKSSPSQGVKTYGPTKRRDTLFAIAEQVRADNQVSLNQVMVAIVAKNPNAFYANNINRMKMGHVIQLPSLQVIQAISKDAARQAVLAQNKAWEAWRRGKVLTVSSLPQAEVTPVAQQEKLTPTEPTPAPTQAQTAPATTSNPVMPVIQSAPPQSVAKPSQVVQLTDTSAAARLEKNVLMGADNTKQASPGLTDSTRAELAVSLDNLSRSKRNNQAIQLHLNDLQAQREFRQQQLRAKDQNILNLQQRIAGKDAEVLQLQQQVLALQTQANKEANSQATQASQTPTATSQASNLDVSAEKNWLSRILVALGLLVLGLAGGLWFSRKWNPFVTKIKDELYSDEVQAPVHSYSSEEEDAAILTGIEDKLAKRSAPLGAHNFNADPLEEIALYLSHKRYGDATMRLREAVRFEPARVDLWLKLLEVHALSGNKSEFEQLAHEIKDKFAHMDDTVQGKIDTLKMKQAGSSGLGFLDDRQARVSEEEAINAAKNESALAQAAGMKSVEGLAGEDPIVTKLDLAKTYVEMGNKQEAAALLKEVISVGSVEQIAAAQAMLDLVHH